MDETELKERLSFTVPDRVLDSLFFAVRDSRQVYLERDDGDLVFIGQRPAGHWHGHGYFPKLAVMLCNGRPVVVRVWKHRWRLAGSHTTCHSRPPDDLAGSRCSTLVVMLKLWAVLSVAVGIHNRKEVFEDLDDYGSTRTVQRWLACAMRNAVEIQQAIGAAARDKKEPRPGEDLFQGGLSPPRAFYRRTWQNPLAAVELWRAIAMLLIASKELGVNASILLAEARRRCQKNEKPFPL